MAQSFVTDQGTLIIPGAYSTYKVQTDNSGLSTTGVIALIGEAEAGPDFSLETNLEENAFGPDQVAEVKAKYRNGPLVDAFRAAIVPSNDTNIQGAPARLVIVKTNPSVKARASILDYGSNVYGYLADRSYGKLGNLIYTEATAKQAEVVPTTGAFTFISPVGAVDYEIRVNGAAAVSGTLTAGMTPAAMQAAVNALSGVAATGGAAVAVHPAVNGNISLAVTSGNAVQIDFTTTLATQPTVGDTVLIPAGSVIAGGASANVGAYVVTGSTTTSISATKLSDAGKTGAVVGTITAPVAVTAVAQSVTATDDLTVYGSVTIANEAGNPIDGIGKSLEIAQLTSGADLLERTAYALNTTEVTWISKDGAPKLLTSSAEYKIQLDVNRQLDGVQQELVTGGEIALKIGYKGTTAAVTVTKTTMTVTVAGGAGTTQTLSLEDFATLNDLASYLNSKTGYSCVVGTGILGQLPSTALDRVTSVGAASTHGEKTGRLKIDAYRFFNMVRDEAAIVQLEDEDGVVVRAGLGLPAPHSIQYLEGGTKGGTTGTNVTDAVDALELVRCNFVVPCFSRDASEDITDALTESASTYTIDAINTAVKNHVNKMSTLKFRKNRQGLLSRRATFEVAREAAANTAAFRCAMTFQDVKNLANDGTIKQFQPWMAAAVAAGMQSAGFYRAIVNKIANINGALQAAGDFDDRSISDMENALKSGLLPLARSETGGVRWVSDQTTYGRDSNFVFNSLQAVYVADIIALTTAQRMENAFLGQNLSEVSAASALSFLQAIFNDYKRLKLVAPSDDAPGGYKDASIKIRGGSMVVSAEVKVNGVLYFIPISFLVSQVQQSAEG